jgi:uncharacterized membrane protein
VNRALLIATVALIAVLFAFSAAVYPELPARIPAHFNGARVDSWANKGMLAWFGLPLLALILVSFNLAIAGVFATRPELMNVPRKARLLALAPERRAHVMAWWWVLMQTIGLVELATLGLAQYVVWRVATGTIVDGRLIARTVTAIALTAIPLSGGIIWRMVDEIGRQERGEG